MSRTEVTVGGCCWAVETTIRRSLLYEVKGKILRSVGQRSHPQVFAGGWARPCVLDKGGHDAADMVGSNRFVVSPSSKTIHCWQSGTRPSQRARRTGHPQWWWLRPV